jgi:hypothetical protein
MLFMMPILCLFRFERCDHYAAIGCPRFLGVAFDQRFAFAVETQVKLFFVYTMFHQIVADGNGTASRQYSVGFVAVTLVGMRFDAVTVLWARMPTGCYAMKLGK